MNESFIGIRYTSPRRLLDNPILTGEEAQIVREDVATNVKMFGAKGDGVTDDTQAFIDALNYFQPSCPVFIPEGVYVISGVLNIPTGSGLIGCSRGKAAFSWSSSVAGAAFITLNDYCVMMNLGFVYTGNVFTGNKYVSILGTRVIVENCDFGRVAGIDTPGVCISFDSAQIASFISNNFLKANIKGIQYTAAAARHVIVNNYVVINGIPGSNCLDTTGAGVLNCYMGNFWSHETGGGPTNHVVVGVAGTYVGNRSVNGIAYAGAGLTTSLLLDTVRRDTGWDTAVVGAAKTAVNALTITATDPNMQALAAVVNGMKSALIQQGLIGT